jgi:hypothetical protein
MSLEVSVQAQSSDFGITPQNPIRVGGGILFGPFNEQQYLARLRFRDGTEPAFKRLGSFTSHDRALPLDIYELSGLTPDGRLELLFDIYTLPAYFDVPNGFAMSRPHEPLRLPTSLVTEFRGAGDAHPKQQSSRRWRILGAPGQTLGFASWDGRLTVDIDLPKHTGELLRRDVDRFLALAPADQIAPVLEDFFERYLILASQGHVRGEPDKKTESPPEWTGRVWGDDISPRPKRSDAG